MILISPAGTEQWPENAIISLILMRQKNLKNISFVLVSLKRQDGSIQNASYLRVSFTWEGISLNLIL